MSIALPRRTPKLKQLVAKLNDVSSQDHQEQFEFPPMPAGRSLLLDLPAELREAIYLEACDDTAHVGLKKKRIMIPELARTNKQVYLEFMAFLYLRSGRIEMEIQRLQFAPVVTFMNHLSDAQYATLPKTTNPTSMRKFVLVLRNNDYELGMSRLGTWLTRNTYTRKRGYGIDFSYAAKIIDSRQKFGTSLYELYLKDVIALKARAGFDLTAGFAAEFDFVKDRFVAGMKKIVEAMEEMNIKLEKLRDTEDQSWVELDEEQYPSYAHQPSFSE